ncbi:leucine-rich repeat serine/threonine-protein kinase 2-like isoform X2 [Myzus persicae]|uniref:leucine-rich repeat serine/threonine-protein kinase 2-like isoform X2 n=1 Tax=Myzus persicae TaxID=13164 RepID=UPI000B935F70|nr:leucine-rich repeat serine/threonine-protein kinase 2-like isoform X2 [Myzus persicae]
MEKEFPDTPDIQSECNDREHYKLTRVQPETTNKKFKLIIVGHSNVGKSTIINHFCSSVYQDTAPTAGMDFQEIFVRFENETILLNIWDTSGTEKHRSLAQSYYGGAHGVFIVYDITDLKSLYKLDGWIKDIEKFSDVDIVKILIGNKCDDKINREISIKEGQEIAEVYGIPFFEVSSKSNINIDKLLYTMISDCIKKEHYKLIRVQPDQNTIYKKYKLIIVGHSNVGKSSIIHRLVKDVYKDTLKTTICIDFHKIFVRFENETIELNIWDTAGTERYRSLAHSYYRGAQGVFIVYDITDLNSSFKLDDWIKDIENFSDLNAVKILIGNKCDDKSNRAISIKEGQKIAELFGTLFFETSSKTNVNIDKLLYTMISKIHELEVGDQQTADEDLIIVVM